ncbi:MAG: sensor histidine kinase [Proteobacteria bacterium]|nr:sensor histidine kinase [Pseudomonadota bacterium]
MNTRQVSEEDAVAASPAQVACSRNNGNAAEIMRLVDTAVMPTLIFDTDMRVRYFNRAAWILGRLINPQAKDFEPEFVRDWHPQLVSAKALYLCRELGNWVGQVKFDIAVGEERSVLVQLSALGVGGAPPYGLCARDVTWENAREAELHSRNAELEMANARIKDVQEQAIQTEKLASIGQLAAGVAHEINNPIAYLKSNLNSLQQYTEKLVSAVQAYADVVARPGDVGAANRVTQIRQQIDFDSILTDVPELLAESREGIERVCKIVSDLKDFSRRDHSDAWVRADLHSGLESTLNIVWNELKYKAQVVKTFGDLPLVECLPSELNQVFMNILINAGQAIKAHGVVTVSTSRIGDKVRISIGDDGEGIPADVLPKIFDPFFTTKATGEGTGLGLAISYGIIAKHHGKIEVTSVPGQGTLFMIELPIDQTLLAGKE